MGGGARQCVRPGRGPRGKAALVPHFFPPPSCSGVTAPVTAVAVFFVREEPILENENGVAARKGGLFAKLQNQTRCCAAHECRVQKHLNIGRAECILLAAAWGYMASEEFGKGEDFCLPFINIGEMYFCFFSWHSWLDCLITWGEVLVKVWTARHLIVEVGSEWRER